MAITLVLTHKPLREFRWNGMSGKWGELVAIRGPKVSACIVSHGTRLNRGSNPMSIQLQHGLLMLSTDGKPIEQVKRFTTMERFRGNTDGYFVQLRPKSDPYKVVFEPNNPVVKTLRPTHDGRCFRIHGAKTIKEQAILIHEAPNVSWLTGCISPRPLGDYTLSYPNGPSSPPAVSMDELIAFVGAERADFHVEDYF
ncbi:MAG: hypothetical protein JNL62_14815 [Bryobacterales bacterium]|nr:hypothetical protein [Bryobacterales bacterium]